MTEVERLDPDDPDNGGEPEGGHSVAGDEWVAGGDERGFMGERAIPLSHWNQAGDARSGDRGSSDRRAGRTIPGVSVPPDLDEADQDRFLVERSRYGDTRAFEALVNLYQQRAVGIARKILFDREAARDVAQEAFIRLYRSLDKFDPSQRFYTWFYRIVVHLAIDHLRRQKHVPQRLGDGEEMGWMSRHRREGIRGEDPRVPDASAALEQEELQGRVASVLARLPEKYRVLMVLRDLEGFTSKEIADIAKCNHATVRWRLHRARKLFKTEWESAGYPPE